MNPTISHLIARMEERRDTLVRRLRTERNPNTRYEMCEALDQVIDEIERLTREFGDND